MKSVNAVTNGIDIMEIDEFAEAASTDPSEFERLLNDFKPFLKAQVSRLAGSWGSQDLFEEMTNDAFLAFYEAVMAYNSGKGHFFPFMRSIVHHRLIDSIRKQDVKSVKTVPLETDDEDDYGRLSPVDLVSVQEYRESDRQRDLVIEIDSFKRELAEWGITMDSLVENSPKHARLRAVCREIIDATAADEGIMLIMWTKNYFPIKKISELTQIPSKTIERVRIFLIGSLIIRAGDYDYLKEYVTN